MRRASSMHHAHDPMRHAPETCQFCCDFSLFLQQSLSLAQSFSLDANELFEHGVEFYSRTTDVITDIL